MGDNFVKKTQDTLGKLIKKPPLTEKLLNKPPFRFLHDVFMEVIRTTGFMKGLYTTTEMDSQNVKDKESKVAFLQKAIDVISMVSGKQLAVKTSKIVAGHEPEKTNEMLQVLAKSILDKLDSSEAVKKVLNGEKPKSSKAPKPKKEETDERKTSGDKRSQDNKDRKDSAEKRGGSGSKESMERKGSADDNKQISGSKERERSRDRSKNQKEQKKERDKGKEKIKDEENKDKESEKDKARKERKRRKELEEAARREKNDGQNEDDEDLRPAAPEFKEGSGRMPRPSSAKGKRSRPMQDGDDSDSDKDYDHDQQRQNGDKLPPQVHASRQIARPSSARPAPPKIKQEPVEDPNIRIGSGKQVTNVIVDNGVNSDDDDDAFLVEESQPLPQDDQQNGPDASPVKDKQIGPSEVEDDGQHGSLVKKIMETKTELERKDQKKDDKPIVLDAARKKERQMVQREVEKLRGFIQTLTRSANPLGKTMDYLQEDMDSMQKELNKWKRENKEHALAIKREENVTEGELEPLYAQLTELDQSIADQVELIGAVKSNILRNEEKMAKMMNSVVLS